MAPREASVIDNCEACNLTGVRSNCLKVCSFRSNCLKVCTFRSNCLKACPFPWGLARGSGACVNSRS